MPGSKNHPQNFVPLPYRHVSVQPYDGPMTEEAIGAHLLGKDSYRRTRYVVLEQGSQCAVAAVSRESEEPLFSQITAVETLALPPACTLVEDPEVDVGNRSALAARALALGLGPESTLVVRGMYQHVNFIHRPNPLKIRVIEVTPPQPPKLFSLARKVLSYADLPAIQLVPDTIELRELAAAAPEAEAFLIPCRASGLGFDKPTYFLDERPPRRDWTMIACERSRQIHQHFYGDEAPCLEMCPRKLTGEDGTPTLLKCCLLEDHIELEGNRAVVPWGADLAQVQEALLALSANGLEGQQ
ncbi:MAG: hypothetical protein ACE5H9_21410 [Anaerolineae bacterium]